MTLEVISRPAAERRHPHPLLFVHGAWHGAWCWDEHFLSHFASLGWDAHALSLRGHAGSSGREGLRRHRIKDYVADVASVVDRLGPNTILVGHSMGGLVVQKFLERRTAPGAVLLASVPPRGVLPLTLRVARRHHARMGDESYLGYLDMLVLALPRPARVAPPLLVIGAGADALFTEVEVRATAAAYGTRPVVVPGVAHDLMLDTGWPAVADAIEAWLADVAR